MRKPFKKISSAIIAMLLVITTVCSIPFGVDAASVSTPQNLESSVSSNFWVDPENVITQDDITAYSSGDYTTMTGAVSIHKRSTSESAYYLFLPSSADCSNLRVWFTATSVTVNGTSLVSGETTNVFSDLDEGGVSKTYTIVIGSTSYSVTAMKSTDVGVVYIDTESGSISSINGSSDHSVSEAGTIMVVDADGNVNYDGEMTKMRGRGNGTWDTSNTKNPYNVKLATSTSLLGMNKAKKWVLLANVNDTTLIKNQLTYDFSKYIGINYQVVCKPVDLYVNQQYYGSYQLAEKVEIKSNRVNVTDAYDNLEIANGTVDETTGITTPLDLSTVSVTTTTGSMTSSTVTSSSAGHTVGAYKYSTTYTSSSSSSSSSSGTISGVIGNVGGGSSSSSSSTTLSDPDDVTGGYLFELEISNRWTDENAGFCAYNRQGWVIKSCDYATQSMVQYSYNLLYALGSAVYNNGIVPSTSTTTSCSSLSKTVLYGASSVTNPAPDSQYQGLSWSDLLDADSAVKYYWTQEYFKNMDSSTSSTYFYKDSDSIDSTIYAGPVWDMDNSICFGSSASRWGYSYTSSTGWYTKNARIYRWRSNDSTTTYSSDAYSPLNFYAALATNCSDFWSMAEQYWYDLIEPATQILLGNAEDSTGTLHSTEYYVSTINNSLKMNNVRLGLSNDESVSSVVSDVNTWFSERNDFINGEISTVDIANATCSTISNQTYTGSEITPDFTLTYGSNTLVEGQHYTVEYSNNVDTGTATITVTGMGRYTGTKTITFKITSASLVSSTISIPETAYAGDTLSVTVTNSNGDEITGSMTYQWRLDGSNISGETDSTLTVDSSYVGSTITCYVKGDGSNVATLGVTSNECTVLEGTRATGMTQTIASWNYDYTVDSEALINADETGETYYYMATSGEHASTASLSASVDATNSAKIKWSGTSDLYSNDSNSVTSDQAPIMSTSKNDGLAWGEYPYFSTTVSTSGYENIRFSAKLGGTKKAPRDWKLQYSLDGTKWIDIEGAEYTITDNKTMELAFDEISLPSACDDQDVIYIRMVVTSDVAINGTNTIIGQTSGDAAVNNVVVIGDSLATVETLEAPTIETDSTVGETTLFDDALVTMTDNNGGATICYTIDGGDETIYTDAFNPFDSTTASAGDKVTITAWATFGDVESEKISVTYTFAGVNITSFNYDDYSQNVSNGAVFSTGGAYDESGKMTATADNTTQYVPLFNSDKVAYSVSPDDGLVWTEDSGFTFEVSTAGYENVTFTAKLYTTAQGPNSISLQYSLDGSSWTTVEENVKLSTGSLSQTFLTASLPSACDNQTTVYVRLATTENKTCGSDTVDSTTLHNNNSKGNLYINDIVIAGDDSGEYKMPYTNKTTNYFGTGAIKYYSVDGMDMYYTVVLNGSIVASGKYPTETGIVLSSLSCFDEYSQDAYTISVWEGDGDDQSLVNVRSYTYKGDTFIKFKYNSSSKLLEDYLDSDGVIATATTGDATLSMYPNAVSATALSFTSKYGVRVSWSSSNIFEATKNLDVPIGNGYWLITADTTGYTGLTINLDQLSSSKGPRDWGMAYSLDGVNFTYIENSNVRAISNDSADAAVETYNNFKLPSECDNQETVYIMIFVNGGESVDGTELADVTKGNTGIDNIEISGVTQPEAVNITVNTAILEDMNGSVSDTLVDAVIEVGGITYNTTDGALELSLNYGQTYTITASSNGSTFFSSATIVAKDGDVVVIPIVVVDINNDGVINAKDLALITKMYKSTEKTYYTSIFSEFAGISSDSFAYAK